MKDSQILIVGGTGLVGSELNRDLKAKGFLTRPTTSKKDAGKGYAYLNLATGEGINKSFEGIDRAFFMSPPGYADQHALLSPLIQEAKRRGLKKVVLMTAMGADANEASPFRRVERELENSGLSYNIIRPNWFFQNFHTFWKSGIDAHDKILLPAGTAKVSFIDARDIAATGAHLLTSDKFEKQAFDLTGPEAVDHTHVATAISKVAGRRISYEEVGDDQFLAGLLGAGLPKDYAQFLVMIFGFLRQGYSERRTSFVKEITGQAPRGLEDYVNDYKTQFNK